MFKKNGLLKNKIHKKKLYKNLSRVKSTKFLKGIKSAPEHGISGKFIFSFLFISSFVTNANYTLLLGFGLVC